MEIRCWVVVRVGYGDNAEPASLWLKRMFYDKDEADVIARQAYTERLEVLPAVLKVEGV